MPNYGQSPPNQDQNWDINNLNFEAIFNGSFDSNDWHKDYGWGTRHPDDDFECLPSNVYLENDYLVLKAMKNPTYNYPDTDPPPLYASVITSTRSDFLYGYYEIECSLELDGSRIMPAFWLWGGNCDNYDWSEEIDIVEVFGDDYLWTSNHHVKQCIENLSWDGLIIDEAIDITTGYHKFALEWTPGKLYYYVDNQIVRTINDSRVPSHGLLLVAQMGFGGTRYTEYDISPNFMKIKSIKVYDLKMNNCDNSITLSNQLSFNYFSFGVYKNITIGNGSNPISLTSNDNKTFRYSDTFTITGPFEAPLESQLTIIPTTCY